VSVHKHIGRVAQQTAKLHDIQWNKISSKNTQLYIYLLLKFHDHSVAVHIPSMWCNNFHILRSFIIINGLCIAEWHHNFKRFCPYLLVSSGVITYYFSIYRQTVLSFYTEKYKNIQTKPKLCNILSVIVISNTLWISHYQYTVRYLSQLSASVSFCYLCSTTEIVIFIL